MAAPALLELDRVSRTFGGIHAVQDVTLALRAGVTTGLIGPNGAGKTTLFNLLSGLERPDTGEIRFGGRRIDRLTPNRIARLGIGRTFQSVRVFGALTVRENLEVADLSAAHAAEPGREGRIDAALEVVDITAHADAVAGRLSYGQRKLVEMAMVLVQSPRMILLDEPVAGVNPVLTDRIGEILEGLARRGHTLLIVEHNVPFVTRLCQRIIVMANGRLLADGSAEAIQADPRVLEVFLGGR